MDDNFRRILLDVRDLTIKFGIKHLTLKNICQYLSIDIEEITRYVPNKETLVAQMLELERESFKIIFDKHSFEGVNAIDILLIVSQEVNNRFKDLSPSVTLDLQALYPEVYQHHIEQRIDFIFEKIKINIHKGISQGMYRDDLSIELLSRLFISRLIDIHNPLFFPPSKFSFHVLFEVMFENFIRGIASKEGLKYYSERCEDLKVSYTQYLPGIAL